MEKINKILLLGSNGQIGSIIKKKIKGINKNTKCISRKDLNLENLKSIDTFLNKIKPQLIINAAAYTKVDDAETYKNICYKINVLATKKIANWAYKNNCFLIHFSTVYIFGKKNNKPWKENDKPNPINFYGRSKLLGEKHIISSKCKHMILRVNWLYSDKGENFPKKIIRKIIKEKEVFVVNNQIGTPNHAEFIANITIKILKKIIRNPENNPKILNISAKGYTSYYGFAKKIHKKLGNKFNFCKMVPVSTQKFKSKVKRPLNSKLDTKQLEKYLNLKLPNWENIFYKKIDKIIKNCTS